MTKERDLPNQVMGLNLTFLNHTSFILLYRHASLYYTSDIDCAFYKLKVCVNPVLSKSISAIFLTPRASHLFYFGKNHSTKFLITIICFGDLISNYNSQKTQMVSTV